MVQTRQKIPVVFKVLHILILMLLKMLTKDQNHIEVLE